MQHTDNEIIQQKNWATRNWKWIIPVVIVIMVLITIVSSRVVKNGSDFAVALNDKPLYDGAVAKCNSNVEVEKVFGVIGTIGEMAILESNVEYGKDKQTVKLTVRVAGEKIKGKMDVEAHKKDNQWQYDSIKLRVKNPKQEIVVVE